MKSIELIGDPYQSIFEWRNARPDLLLDIAGNRSVGWKTLPLNLNRRSTPTIIKCFSILRQVDQDPITSSIINLSKKQHPILILKYSPENEIDAVNKFLVYSKLFKDNRVVVRGIPLRDKLLGRNDSGLVYWKSDIAGQVIIAKQEFSRNLIKSAVNRVRMLIPTILDPNIDHIQRKEQIEDLKYNHEVNSWIIQLLISMPSFDLTLLDWTLQTQIYLSDSLSSLFAKKLKVDFELKQGIIRKKHSQNMFELIGLNQEGVINIDISTIHQVKGMTLDTLLLILNKNSVGPNISINDICKPLKFPTEKQRLIYVAMSRPRSVLAIGLPNTISDDVLHEKFGKDIEIE